MDEAPFTHGEGSPAHAGIDPGKLSDICCCVRFPRTRGDRPEAAIDAVDEMEVPPPHAGDSRNALEANMPPHGSPAHGDL